MVCLVFLGGGYFLGSSVRVVHFRGEGGVFPCQIEFCMEKIVLRTILPLSFLI